MSFPFEDKYLMLMFILLTKFLSKQFFAIHILNFNTFTLFLLSLNAMWIIEGESITAP